jgi:hypothetical protein
MQCAQQTSAESPSLDTIARADAASYDPRFRRLVGTDGWAQLPPTVQRRFSKRITAANLTVFRGTIIETRLSAAGWLLAQLTRLIGAPLPLHRDAGVAAAVAVSEDGHSGGQCWTRIYARHHGFPQVIHSAKRFAGPTGLEEYLGAGVGMALTVNADVDGLVFVSDHYFLRLGTVRFRLPRWLSPGTTRVEHRDRGDGAFAFDLEVRHPVLGVLVSQHALFRDA